MRVPYRLAGGDPARRPDSDEPPPPTSTCALCAEPLDGGAVVQFFCPDARLRDVHEACLRALLLEESDLLHP